MRGVPLVAELITVNHFSMTYYPAGCGDPLPPANGSVIWFVSAAEGSHVLFSCDQGFLPAELMNSRCSSGMNWSPNPADFTCREQGE